MKLGPDVGPFSAQLVNSRSASLDCVMHGENILRAVLATPSPIPENSIVSNFVHLPVNRVRRAKIWTIWFSQLATQIRRNHVQQAQNMLCILAIGLLSFMTSCASFAIYFDVAGEHRQATVHEPCANERDSVHLG